MTALYIGVYVPKQIVVQVLKYDDMRRAIVECIDRDQLLAAIALHLRRVMSEGGSLREAYQDARGSKSPPQRRPR